MCTEPPNLGGWVVGALDHQTWVVGCALDHRTWVVGCALNHDTLGSGGASTTDYLHWSQNTLIILSSILKSLRPPQSTVFIIYPSP